MLEFSILIILIAGIVTVFLPCTYPMIIGYIALLLSGKERSTKEILNLTAWFFIGFTTVYTIFGTIAGFAGQFSQTTIFFNILKPYIATVGGIFFILIGLLLLKKLPLPNKLKAIHSIKIPKSISPNAWWSSFLIGVIFAAGWSPCIGPVLGGILILAATSGSAITGGLYLILFSVGMMIPFIILSLLYNKAGGYIKKGEKFIPIMNTIAAIIFIAIGILFIVGDFQFLSLNFGYFEGIEKYI